MPEYTPTVLTIAGSDPYGGAGIQVDTKVIHALDGYAFSVITALTAQNSTGVKSIWATPTDIVKSQLETILDDIEVDAVKIGMLANAETVEVVVKYIQKYKLKNIVLDTVLVSSSGTQLLEKNAIELMVKELFPLVDMITPNIPEVNTLLGTDYVGDENEIECMAKGLFDLGAKAVLIKGGHSMDSSHATDYLAMSDIPIRSFSSLRIDTNHTHGTGCVLSSAIASSLAQGIGLEKSIQSAKAFLYRKLAMASNLEFNYIHKNATRREPLI